MKLKISEMKCVAPNCDRNADCSTDRGPCCNLHYLRLRSHGDFDSHRPVAKPDVHKCAQCGITFRRGYAIASARARRHQFCSPECNKAHTTKLSDARVAKRFWANVDIQGDDQCWPWKGRIGTHGYGAFDYKGRPHIASRFAYTISKGDAAGFHVCHACDNPPCCNPAHLWLGTHADNMLDMTTKGRQRSVARRGGDHPQARLTAEDVVAIRGSHEPPKVVALRYGVTAACIYRVRHRLSWAHVK